MCFRLNTDNNSIKYNEPINSDKKMIAFKVDSIRRKPFMTRKQYTPEEEAFLALEAIRGKQTINEIASDNGIHPNQISRWKKEAETEMYHIFQDNTAKKRKIQKEREEEVDSLYTQIGKLTTQIEWLKKIWLLIFPHMNAACWWR